MDFVVSTYNEIASQYEAEFSTPTDFFDDFLDLLPSETHLLDLGCGPGVEIAHSIKRGFMVEGVDLSEEMISLAKKKNPEVHISHANIINFVAAKKKKACIASYSLIHLPKKVLPQAIENISRNLKKDGFLYVAVHEGRSEELVLDEPFNPKLKIFLNIFSKQELIDLLEKGGFKIIETKIRPPQSEEEFSYNKLIVFAQRTA